MSDAATGTEQPFYFPVLPDPLLVRPGLFRFGTDFGNGIDDSRYFQRGNDIERVLTDKRRVLDSAPERLAMADGSDTSPALLAVIEAMTRRFEDEHGRSLDVSSSDDPRTRATQLATQVGEDFIVLLRDATGNERTALVCVCFPSGWAPERIVGLSFQAVHSPVPGFDSATPNMPGLVSALFEKGPYVRFVWTVCPDAVLDHHPTSGREAWTRLSPRGYLRVERQLTIPLAPLGASLFLIRTYVYPFRSLSAEQRTTLSLALKRMPPKMVRYKGLEIGSTRARQLLDATT